MDQAFILVAAITAGTAALITVVTVIALRRRLTFLKSGKLKVRAEPREMDAKTVKLTDGSQIDLLKGTSTSARTITVDGKSVYRTRDVNEQPLPQPEPKEEGPTSA